MTFSGTVEKCKTCDKTVHFFDMLSADGVPYHKNCFRCTQCNGRLAMSTYSSLNGVLYCKPHFEQFLKQSGNFAQKFQPSGNRPNGLSRAPSKLSALFSGTQEKCVSCKKTAYPLEKVTVEGEIYHKTCFRCSHGGCFLTPSSYAALDGILYCKHHFSQLFKEKGSYSSLNKAASMKKNGEAMSLKTEQEEERPTAEADGESKSVAEQPNLDVAITQEQS